MNTVVQVILWLLEGNPHFLEHLGQGTTFFRALLCHDPQHPKNLLQDMLWRMTIAGWAESHRQHDVTEFFSYLVRKHKFGMLEGTWQARRVLDDGVMTIRDQGSCAQPIILRLPAVPPGLHPCIKVQSLIDYWSGAQECLHALHVPPPILVLQLDRFAQTRGRIAKREDDIEPELRLAVPIFGAGDLGIDIRFYQLKATITHHGLHPCTGHYTSCLLQAETIWSCDDNRSASSSRHFPSSHAKGCYMLFYELCSTF